MGNISPYGKLPSSLGEVRLECKEMMFYQYLPIKLTGRIIITIEDRLLFTYDIIEKCRIDYIKTFGIDDYIEKNIYLTVKRMYQMPGCSFNREGWHSDGFMTDDINYIWSNNNGCTYNYGLFNLTQDHQKSLEEMESQADPRFESIVSDNELIRLDQFTIHKVSDIKHPCMRTFFKLSISSDKYNLIGNSKNYLLDYDWEMKERETERNHPSK